MATVLQIREQLHQQLGYLAEKYGVKSLAVFGSISRGEATSESDVDILVEFNRDIGIEFIDLALELEEILGCKVDLVSRRGLKPSYFESIEADLQYV